jgi:hypothetical protein
MKSLLIFSLAIISFSSFAADYNNRFNGNYELVKGSAYDSDIGEVGNTCLQKIKIESFHNNYTKGRNVIAINFSMEEPTLFLFDNNLKSSRDLDTQEVETSENKVIEHSTFGPGLTNLYYSRLKSDETNSIERFDDNTLVIKKVFGVLSTKNKRSTYSIECVFREL